MNFILYAAIRIKLTPSELSRRHQNFVDGIIILLTQSEFVRSIRNVWLDPKPLSAKKNQLWDPDVVNYLQVSLKTRLIF